MGVLKGPRTKLQRADAQARILDRQLSDALEPDPAGIPVEFEHNTEPFAGGLVWHVTAKVGSDLPSLPTDFGLALGECLHNYRGALDHLAWRLVPSATKTNLSAHAKRSIQFPMAKTRWKYWHGHARNRLPGVAGGFLTLFERYQPYRRSTEGRVIRFLRDLTNLDKHRTIIVARTMIGEGSFDFRWERGQEVGRQEHIRAGQRVERGTPIATVSLAAPANMKPYMTVEGTIDYGPAFPPSVLRPFPGGVPVAVRPALGAIAYVCEEILSEAEALL